MKATLSDLLQSVRVTRIDPVLVEIGETGGARFTSGRSAFFHLVLKGNVIVDNGDEAQAIHLRAGDFAASLGSRWQSLTHSSTGRLSSSAYFMAEHAHDYPPTIRFGSGPCTARVLVSTFRVFANPLIRAMPKRMVVRRDDPTCPSLINMDVENIDWVSVGSGSSAILSSTFQLLFLQAIRAQAVSGRAGLELPLDSAHFRIPTALNLIHAHPEWAWTLERAATSVGVSRATFAAQFKQIVGQPLMEYLTHLRMKRAADMLCGQPVTISDIAHNSGYNSVTSFTRAFRRFHGVTPAAYQRQQSHSIASIITDQLHWTPFLGEDV